MKVTGFTIIRNAVKYDFPIVEAIRSVLPLCTDFVVAIGNSDDDTIGLIERIGSDKIRILHTVWDDSKRTGGVVLAEETNKAFQSIGEDADWCIYIQGDEVMHEDGHKNVMAAMQRYKDDPRIDGLIFRYIHFYGSYHYKSVDPSAFKHEIRVIKNDKRIYSYRDAQGFRKGNDEKLNVAEVNALIYHYTKVNDPGLLQVKHKECSRYWHDDQWIETEIGTSEQYDFTGVMLVPFKGRHPAVMNDRIEKAKWRFEHNTRDNKFTLKKRLKMMLEFLGFNLSYRNYKLVR